MSMKENKYRLVLGLEIHLHVKSQTKMFCGCDANIFKAEPNTHTCPTCLALPGALPVPNKEAVEKTHLLGVALNCKLNECSRFDRKHYFYPDLPKGYQISQYKQPFCEGGHITLDSGKKIEIERIHLEEDTAKSHHEDDKTLIDFNMSGMPLIELVTKPVFTSASDAGEFARKLREIVRALDVGNADMEKGQLRIEPNISVRTVEMEEKGELPDYKVEIKNINSFKFMEKAVKYEFERQSALLQADQEVLQENRGWDEKKSITVLQRQKEEAHDYRYFPEPDIPPMKFDNEYFDNLKDNMLLQNLPAVRVMNLTETFKLTEQKAKMLLSLSQGSYTKIIDEFRLFAEKTSIEHSEIAKLLINKPEFRGLKPKEFENRVNESLDKLDSSDELNAIIKKVLKENEKVVQDIKNGKDNAIQFLLGQVMRESKGKADPKIAKGLIQNFVKG